MRSDLSLIDWLRGLIDAVRAECRLDARTAVFDVRPETRGETVVLVGETTEAVALDDLLDRARCEVAGEIRDEVVRLPDPALGGARHAVIGSALAPVHAEPAITSTQVSQLVIGQRADLLGATGRWRRVRGEDGYIGWVHHGYLEVGDREWARAWEQGNGAEAVISLGADLVDAVGEALVGLPWGGRLLREPQGIRLPDGRTGELAAGEVVAVDRLSDRFPPRRERIMRTALDWNGSPYVWGGVTPAGVDCSGFVQAVFRMHGIQVGRDSDMQAGVGTRIQIDDDFDALRPADLLFFAEHEGRIDHVAISLGGSRIVHASLSRGGVAVNDLLGGQPNEEELRHIFVLACALVPD